jgi:ketosteroid isomerase-like protein
MAVTLRRPAARRRDDAGRWVDRGGAGRDQALPRRPAGHSIHWDPRGRALTPRTGTLHGIDASGAPVEVNGISPTGKPIRVDAISVFRMAGGRIAETWEVWDTLGFLQQIGVVPAMV